MLSHKVTIINLIFGINQIELFEGIKNKKPLIYISGFVK